MSVKNISNLQIKALLSLLILFVFWFVSFNSAIVSAVDIWAGNEIFNHGFLIVPGSFYLIYRALAKENSLHFLPNYYLIVPLIITLLIYQFGKVGDINVFMHFAAFTFLPLMIWLCFGNRIANKIKFPLIFILFSIPVGEQLIPHLQELTTNLAVPILRLFDVPVFRSGLYLEIPQGQFLVAEACSGISFFIGSLVFGSLYTYLTFKSWKNRVLFITISLLLPIIANAIRVFGIIYIAYLTDMEHAVGADHLIYGWFFYLLVLFILVMLGEFWRNRFEPKDAVTQQAKNESLSLDKLTKPVAGLIALLIVNLLWKPSAITSDFVKIPTSVTEAIEEQPLKNWQPSFVNPDQKITGRIKSSEIDVYIAAYSTNNKQGELVSSLNRVYSDKRWTLVSSQVNTSEQSYSLLSLASKSGDSLFVKYSYRVGDKLFASATKAKLYSTWLKLINQDTNRVFIATASYNKEQLTSSELVSSIFRF